MRRRRSAAATTLCSALLIIILITMAVTGAAATLMGRVISTNKEAKFTYLSVEHDVPGKVGPDIWSVTGGDPKKIVSFLKEATDFYGEHGGDPILLSQFSVDDIRKDNSIEKRHLKYRSDNKTLEADLEAFRAVLDQVVSAELDTDYEYNVSVFEIPDANGKGFPAAGITAVSHKDVIVLRDKNGNELLVFVRACLQAVSYTESGKAPYGNKEQPPSGEDKPGTSPTEPSVEDKPETPPTESSSGKSGSDGISQKTGGENAEYGGGQSQSSEVKTEKTKEQETPKKEASGGGSQKPPTQAAQDAVQNTDATLEMRDSSGSSSSGNRTPEASGGSSASGGGSASGGNSGSSDSGTYTAPDTPATGDPGMGGL